MHPTAVADTFTVLAYFPVWFWLLPTSTTTLENVWASLSGQHVRGMFPRRRFGKNESIWDGAVGVFGPGFKPCHVFCPLGESTAFSLFYLVVYM